MLRFKDYKCCLCIAVLLSAFLYGRTVRAQDIQDPETIMGRVRSAVASITDYTCLFSKHELVGGRIIRENNISLKVKRPGHFYMKWTEGVYKGRVAIYVEGRNNDKILLHLNGLLGFLNLSIDPKGKEALMENRHTMTEADFISIFDRFSENCERCRKDAGCGPVVSSLKDPDTLEIKAEFPQGKGYYTHLGRLTVDRRTWLPTGLACYGWDNEFLEEYHFDDIKINPGLTGKDFERDR